MMSDNTYTLRKLTRPAKRRNGVAAPAASNQGGSTASYLSILEQKLDKAVFDELFEKVEVNGETKIRANYSLYADGSLSAKGADQGGAGNGGGYGLMREWPTADPGNSTLFALGANLGYDLYKRVQALEGGSGGLDETQLAAYLSTNNYAKLSDVPSLSGYATQQWVTDKGYALNSDLTSHTGNATVHITATERSKWNNKVDKEDGKGLSANDFTDTLLTKLNGIEAGANKYTHPTGGANSTITAASGKVLSSITVNSLGHVTAVGSKTLAAADIPTLSIAKISGLQSAIDAKLSASAFNDLFEKVTIGSKTWIRANYAFYSVDSMSALGPGGGADSGSGSGGGGGYDRLDAWGDYALAKAGYVLSAALGYELHTRVTSIEGKNYLDALSLTQAGSGNAVTAVALSADKKTLTVTKGTTFLTQHQTLDHINLLDVRNSASNPNTYSKSLRYLFKENTNIGLSDGGTYTSVLHLAQWGVNDASGGKAKQLAFTDNGNMYLRSAAMNATTWSDWKRLAFTSDLTWDNVTGKPNLVTTDTAQTISGVKTFTNGLKLNTGTSWDSIDRAIPFSQNDEPSILRYYSTDSNKGLTYNPNTGALKAGSFVKRGGTSSQFLKADGSVDSNSYALASALGSYLPLSGGRMTNTNVVTHLNADLWDGEHLSLFRMRKYYTIDTTSLSTSNFYPITVDPSDFEWDCEIHSKGANASDPWNQNHIHFLSTARGWNDTVGTFIILSHGVYQSNEITIGAVGSGNRNGLLCVWVRGGNVYRIYSNKVPTLRTSDYSNGGETYTVGTNYYGGTNANVTTVWTASNPTAECAAKLNSTVSAATQLATTHTIWGQDFNGTQNVSGNMTGVGSITASGILEIPVARLGSYLFFKNSSNTKGTYITPTSDGGIAFNTHENYSYKSSLGVLTNSGNVGIGTTSPAYKLDVNGTFRATGEATVPRLNIVGSNSSDAYLCADTAHNVFFNVGGRTPFVISGEDSCIRPGSSYNNVFALGKAAVRFTNVYSVKGNFSDEVSAKTVKVGSIVLEDDNGKLKINGSVYTTGSFAAKGSDQG